jgi:hypothetical protein
MEPAPVLPEYGRRFRGNMPGERYLANINIKDEVCAVFLPGRRIFCAPAPHTGD